MSWTVHTRTSKNVVFLNTHPLKPEEALDIARRLARAVQHLRADDDAGRSAAEAPPLEGLPSLGGCPQTGGVAPRDEKADGGSLAEPVQCGVTEWRLQLIEEKMTAAPQTCRLTELATLCELSVRQLTRTFRASRGCSIKKYAAQRRVEQAKRLLEGDESIKAISYAMGFSSPASFCYAFRRDTGEAPGRYRCRFREARQRTQ
jgi:AraC-like DNA-binding protein